MAGADPEKLMAKADKLSVHALRNLLWLKLTCSFQQLGLYRLFSVMIGLQFNENRDISSSTGLCIISVDLVPANLGNCFSNPDNKLISALEDAKPEEAIAMYTDACSLLEEDGKENMAFDLYRAITNVYIKLEKYTDAATFLLRWAVAANKCNALHSMCKAYLSAIIVYLAAHDFKQAEQCYNDCCQQLPYRQHPMIDTFLSSDQSHCASKLLSAYREADVEEIKRVAKSSTISNLDHMIIRLARKLPAGELVAMEVGSLENGEALDEDDLT
ncbi:hypothetical protein L1987_59192 [Smallanthus sonchifolius]|uniref:Uncharacterized protein n=1 Tax=Smallanthus sonchifolius TaxID=185202 RepID=A0ACB9D4I4_9ASTR|nr:hypothetical protein L1987_59192 [Smallanthus sonchifolius]